MGITKAIRTVEAGLELKYAHLSKRDTSNRKANREHLPEAWELVERGHVAADDFKAFTHDNALTLWGDEMFADTVIAAR
jgi:hypothetical protein